MYFITEMHLVQIRTRHNMAKRLKKHNMYGNHTENIHDLREAEAKYILNSFEHYMFHTSRFHIEWRNLMSLWNSWVCRSCLSPFHNWRTTTLQHFAIEIFELRTTCRIRCTITRIRCICFSGRIKSHQNI